jgi:hypothetical protein
VAQRLQRGVHGHDFTALVSDPIHDLTTLAVKYKGLLQALYAAPELVAVESSQADDLLPLDDHTF